MLRRGTAAAMLVLASAALGGLSATAGAAPAQAADELVGTFAIAPGSCSPTPSGSYFRMVHPTGTVDAGPYVVNSDSTCSDTTYTPLAPGTDGGLVTGGYQPAPDPGFDAGGNSLAVRVIRPVRFFSVDFSGSTNPTDLQTGRATPVPSVRDEGGRLTGDLAAFAATWNGQAFNQGAPKPDGSRPGNTTPVRGTFDAASGAFRLTWASQIVGGPFNNFTGVWHLEGTFRPAGGGAPPSGAAPAAPTPAAGDVAPDVAAPQAPGADTPGPASGDAPAADATPADRVAQGDDQAALVGTVRDESYEAPTWLVVALALVGIAGVVTLLALGPRPRGSASLAPGVSPLGSDDREPAGRRWPLRAVVAIGLGLALAPVVFQMFSRAPGGGEMIDDFAPHMTEGKIGSFQDDMASIDAAHHESVALAAQAPDAAARFPRVAELDAAWPAIYDDMSSMLDTMDQNIDNYDGVAALPPFALFPWFFVIPGVALAGVAGWSLRADRGVPARGRRIALAALAVGLIAAPAIFQMWTRAPGGADMIDDFKPFMKPAKVTEIQGYFLTIGAGEGELRLHALPELTAAGATGSTAAIEGLNETWPRISNEMAPMIGTMADNVDRFEGIAALPPFWLFPWFFVIPGVLVLGLLWRTRPAVAPVTELRTLEGTLTPS